MSSLDKVKEWWAQAPKRDQLAVVICGFALFIYILFVAVLNPLYEGRAAHERSITSAKTNLAELKKLTAQLKGTASNNKGSQSIVPLVDSSLRKYGLRLSNMQPNGRSDVRVRIDSVAFDKLLPWVNHIETEKGVQIRDIDISPTKQKGYVSVTLRLHKSS